MSSRPARSPSTPGTRSSAPETLVWSPPSFRRKPEPRRVKGSGRAGGDGPRSGPPVPRASLGKHVPTSKYRRNTGPEPSPALQWAWSVAGERASGASSAGRAGDGRQEGQGSIRDPFADGASRKIRGIYAGAVLQWDPVLAQDAGQAACGGRELSDGSPAFKDGHEARTARELAGVGGRTNHKNIIGTSALVKGTGLGLDMRRDLHPTRYRLSPV